MEELIQFATGLSGVVAMTADEASGAPEAAWGDTFIYYDPDAGGDRRFPFATIVTKDYPGFDTYSDLNRPGVFRLNISVGRKVFEDLLGHSPAAQAEHQADYDYAILDQVIPHPVYAVQGWVSIINPAERSGDQARTLIMGARDRDAARQRRR